MQWKEVNIAVAPRATDAVALLLYECGSNGAVIHDEETDECGRIRITAYFPSQPHIEKEINNKLQVLATGENLSLAIAWQPQVADETEWLYTWQQYFHATDVTRRCRIIPAWEVNTAEKNEINIIVDPGRAFGSGLHETTAMCIRLLEKYVRSEQQVWDIGTGTGILAIAAAKYGAAAVKAVDIDEASVQQAVKNVQRNDVAAQVQVERGDLLQNLTSPKNGVDLVVANLVTDPVVRLLAGVHRFIKKGGHLIVSGIIDTRIEEVYAAVKRYGFIVREEKKSNGWYALYLQQEE